MRSNERPVVFGIKAGVECEETPRKIHANERSEITELINAVWEQYRVVFVNRSDHERRNHESVIVRYG